MIPITTGGKRPRVSDCWGSVVSQSCFCGSKHSASICFSKERSRAVIQTTRNCACLWRWWISILFPTLTSPRKTSQLHAVVAGSRVFARWLALFPTIQGRTGSTALVRFPSFSCTKSGHVPRSLRVAVVGHVVIIIVIFFLAFAIFFFVLFIFIVGFVP